MSLLQQLQTSTSHQTTNNNEAGSRKPTMTMAAAINP
jgi:hypothetical protein